MYVFKFGFYSIMNKLSVSLLTATKSFLILKIAMGLILQNPVIILNI